MNCFWLTYINNSVKIGKYFEGAGKKRGDLPMFFSDFLRFLNTFALF